MTSGPNGQVTAWYDDGTEIRFELEKGPMSGAIFVGEKGKLEINRNKSMSNPIAIRDELIKKVDESEEDPLLVDHADQDSRVVRHLVFEHRRPQCGKRLADKRLRNRQCGYRIGAKRIALRLAVFISPSRHDTLTRYRPGLGKFSQPMGNS